MATAATTAKSDRRTCLRSFPPDQRYLIGVSGGRDSVALLHGLLGAGYGKLIVCHLNHPLRGRAIDGGCAVRREARRSERAAISSSARRMCVQLAADDEAFDRNGGASGTLSILRRGRAAASLPHDFPWASCGRSRRNFPDQSFSRHRRRRQRSHPGSTSCRRRRRADDRPSAARRLARGDRRLRRSRAAELSRRREQRQLDPTRNRMRHRIIPLLEKEFGRGIRKPFGARRSIAAEEDAFLERFPAGRPRRCGLVRRANFAPCQSPCNAARFIRWLRQRMSRMSASTWSRVSARLLELDARLAKINLPGDRHARRRARGVVHRMRSSRNSPAGQKSFVTFADVVRGISSA